MYFYTIFDVSLSVYNDSFGCTGDTNIFYEIFNNELQLNNNNNDNLLGHTSKPKITDLFHIIDQESVLYLILLQMLSYNQQYVSPSGLAVIDAISFIAGDSRKVATEVMMKAYNTTCNTTTSVVDKAMFSIVSVA